MSTLFLIGFGVIALFLIIWAVFSAFTKKQEVYPENWEIEIPEEFLIPFRPEEKVVLKGTEKEPKRENEKKVSTKKKETKKQPKVSSPELNSEKPKRKTYKKYNRKKKDSDKDKGNDLLLS